MSVDMSSDNLSRVYAFPGGSEVNEESSGESSSDDQLPNLFSSTVAEAEHPYFQSMSWGKITMDKKNGIMFCNNGERISITSTLPKVCLTNFKVQDAVRFITKKGKPCQGQITMCKNSSIGNLTETLKKATISFSSDSSTE